MESVSDNKSNINFSRETLVSLLKLALPAIVQQLLGSLLQYVDTAMVGHLGQNATAAVSTSTTINWLIHSFSFGFAIAIMTLMSQAFGRGDKDKMKKLSVWAFKLTFIVGGSITLLCVLISPFLPIWMHADKTIRGAASEYFCIVSLSLMFSCGARIFASAMQALKDTKTPMIVNLSSNVLNVILNYLLIYRADLGVRGAAIATLISTIVCGISMWYVYSKRAELKFTRDEFKINDTKILKELMKVAVPVLGTSVVSCMGYVVFASMVESMSVTVFAAHSIAVSAEEIFYLAGYGIRTASSAMIGIAIGQCDGKKFGETVFTSVVLTVVIMIVSGIILFFVAYPLMKVFTTSEEVAVIGARVLKIVAFSEPLFGLMVAWEGVYYGVGKTRSVFVIESFSMWVVRILMTYFVIYKFHMGLNAVWYCMIADNAFKAIALTVYGVYSIRNGNLGIKDNGKTEVIQ